MGRKQQPFSQGTPIRGASLPGQRLALSLQRRVKTPAIGRWLSAGIIAIMMALTTLVIAAEIPPGAATPSLSLASPLQSPLQPTSPSSQATGDRSNPHNPQQLAQSIRRKDISEAVLQQLPDLPRENGYISKTSGRPSETNSLVSRMIEYHNFRKGRSPASRFDWKLTLADYLGIHEVIRADDYPGITQLTQNPMAGDIAAVKSLSRDQRQALINTVVSLYNPNIPAEFFTPAQPAPNQSAPNQPAKAPSQPESPPPVTGPGAADLLRPRP